MASETTELQESLQSTNIAETLDKQFLADMGADIVKWVQTDEDSRSVWMQKYDNSVKLATQVEESKSYPWRNASNVKYPLLTTAALQFHARAHQSLLKGPDIVKARVIGKDDEQQSKRKRADRISKFMSYQLMESIPAWQDDMDRLLYLLPITGLCFKKTHFDPTSARPVSEIVLPLDLIINYHAPNFLHARKTHRLWLSSNKIIESQRKEIFLDVDLTQPVDSKHTGTQDERQGISPPADSDDLPHEVYESHCFYDIDGDGYKEPYIVTVHKETSQVLRVIARFDEEGVEVTDKGEVSAIAPVEYFSRYAFLPDPESNIYGLGFGSMLGPLNKAVNTLINQLIDAGHLAVLPSGFLGRGVRIPKGGTMRFAPGMFKVLNTPGDDIRKGVYPLPIQEPSQVLFSLLGQLVSSGEKVGSVTEALLGENPGQNQPYSTTMAVMEQGLKVFTGIYKRVYRALTTEYKQLYRLNRMFLEDGDYANVLDDELAVTREDFEDQKLDIVPGADPDVVSETQKLLKAEALLQKLMMKLPINPMIVTRQVLEAEGQPDIDQLMDIPKPPPPFEQQLQQAEFKHKSQLEWAKFELQQIRDGFANIKDRAQALLNQAKAEDLGAQVDLESQKIEQAAIDSDKNYLVNREKTLVDFMKTKQQGEYKLAGEKLSDQRAAGAKSSGTASASS